MFQPTLIARLGALVLGANLALAASAWAAPPAAERPHAAPSPRKQPTAKKKPSPLPAQAQRAVAPNKVKAPRSFARPFEPVKPSGTTGKSLVRHEEHKSAKGHHDEQKSTDAAGRAQQQPSGSHSSTSETGGTSSGAHGPTQYFDKHGNLHANDGHGNNSTLYNDGTLEVDHAKGGTDYYHGDWKFSFDKDGHLTMTKVGPPDGQRKVLDPDHPGYYTDGTKVK